MLEAIYVFLGKYLILALGLIIVYYWRRKEESLVLKLILACALAVSFSEVIKILVPEARPPTSLIGSIADSSFPSSHTAAAVALATTLWFQKRNSRLVVLLVALGVAVGRVLVGAHYPFDVLGGAVVGFVTARLVVPVEIYLKKDKK
ncbi:MAG: phosphatase PAP2 family protein [bacterium]|nr:phosphatase PAP2 family protein [bacterium]